MQATEEHQFVQSTDSNMKSLLPASLNGDNNEESILSSYSSWLVSSTITYPIKIYFMTIIMHS